MKYQVCCKITWFSTFPCTVQPHNYQLITYSDGLLFPFEVYQFNIFPYNAKYKVFYNTISFSILSSKTGGKLIIPKDFTEAPK